jgi:hypothetical protein
MTFGMTVTGNARSLIYFGFRARVLRAFAAKNASGSLGALVAYEQQRRVG